MASSTQGRRDSEDDENDIPGPGSQGPQEGSNFSGQSQEDKELQLIKSMSSESGYEPIMTVDRDELKRVASESTVSLLSDQSRCELVLCGT